MKDRDARYPGRFKIEKVSNGIYDLSRADEPIEEGTILNADNLLSDATAAKLGLTSDATPNDAFAKLAEGGGGGSVSDDYLPLTGGTISGVVNIRDTSGGNAGGKITFGDGDYVYLEESTDDALTIRGGGVIVDASGSSGAADNKIIIKAAAGIDLQPGDGQELTVNGSPISGGSGGSSLSGEEVVLDTNKVRIRKGTSGAESWSGARLNFTDNEDVYIDEPQDYCMDIYARDKINLKSEQVLINGSPIGSGNGGNVEFGTWTPRLFRGSFSKARGYYIKSGDICVISWYATGVCNENSEYFQIADFPRADMTSGTGNKWYAGGGNITGVTTSSNQSFCGYTIEMGAGTDQTIHARTSSTSASKGVRSSGYCGTQSGQTIHTSGTIAYKLYQR